MPLRLDINGATFVIFAQATAPLAAAAVGAVGVASVAASLAAGSQRLPVNMRLLCRQGFLLHTCVWLLLLPLLLPSLQHLLGRARRLGLRVRWWQLLSTQLQVQGSQLLHHVVHHGQQGTAPRLAQVHVRVERRVSTGRCLPGCRLLPRRWVGAACQRHRDNATGGLHVAQLRRPLAAAGAALPPKVDGNGHAAAVHLVPPARGDVQRIPGCQRRMLSKRKRTPEVWMPFFIRACKFNETVVGALIVRRAGVQAGREARVEKCDRLGANRHAQQVVVRVVVEAGPAASAAHPQVGAGQAAA
mmetsp:Transcript_29684/g.87879  ORF Transcript_29684/g.87879 Transcript_29684/m.87879 type:complete len:301 (-) Transcript_29684:424-1326(-)